MDERRLVKPAASPRRERSWTQAEDYVEAMARKRTARSARAPSRRTQPEVPRFSLSTLPFLALIIALLLLTIAIAVAAWPGAQPEPKAQQVASAERGVAPKGWFQEAEKEMRRQ